MRSASGRVVILFLDDFEAVWVTLRGTHFHLFGCPGLGVPARMTSKNLAVLMGYFPCSRCYEKDHLRVVKMGAAEGRKDSERASEFEWRGEK